MVKPLRIQVYVEGGGPTRSGDLADECRKGFSSLFAKATGRRIGITACPYDKVRDSFKILARVEPQKLAACAHAQGLFEELKRALA